MYDPSTYIDRVIEQIIFGLRDKLNIGSMHRLGEPWGQISVN
jgi:hypothetical protein